MSSNISKQEQKKNPQAVLDVLNWFDSSNKEIKGSKYMTTTKMVETPRPSLRHGESGSSQSQNSALSQPSSSTPSSTTPTDTEGTAGITSEEEPPPPPIATRPERTKSIVSTARAQEPAMARKRSRVVAHFSFHFVLQYTKPVNDEPAELPIKTANGTIPFSPILDKNKNAPVPMNSPIPSSVKSASVPTNTSTPANSTTTPRRKKMSDEEILERLRTIVSIGDPNRKYTKMEKIGQG